MPSLISGRIQVTVTNSLPDEGTAYIGTDSCKPKRHGSMVFLLCPNAPSLLAKSCSISLEPTCMEQAGITAIIPRSMLVALSGQSLFTVRERLTTMRMSDLSFYRTGTIKIILHW
jgi:hypothetical protein